jgi:hypothetical protein
LTQPSFTANITPAPLTITADEVFKTTGTTLITPASGSTAFFAEGLVGTETIGSVTITYTSGFAQEAAVGTYSNAVVPSAATGGTFAAANYTITYVPADLVVGRFLYARDNGVWSNTSTWSSTGPSGSSCNCIPTATDMVIIRNKREVTVNTSTAVCAKIELGANAKDSEGTLYFSASGNPKLTVSGQMIVGGWGSDNSNRQGRVYFSADSDAVLVKGIVGLLVNVYSDATADDILATKPDFLKEVGITEHLSMNRSNGLAAMMKQMQMYALVFKSMQKA